MTNDVENIWNTPSDPTSGISYAALDTFLQKRPPYTLAVGEDIQTIDIGTDCLAVVKDGVLFHKDATDTTSSHDGTLVLVSQDLIRFKSSAVPYTYAAEAIQNAPPGSPSLGDTYIIGAAPSGAWASNAKNIAIWTPWEWRFITPRTGMHVYVKTDLGFWHYNNSAAWVSGFGTFTISDDSVRPKALKFPAGITATSTLNTPPVSPSDGDTYIIGTSPTGAWVGLAGQIAYYNVSTWTYLDPATGWIVYDQNQNKALRFTGGAWIDLVSVGKIINVAVATDDVGFIPGNVSTDHASYQATVSDSGDGKLLFNDYAAQSASNRLRITVGFNGAGYTSGTVVMGVMFDTETTPRTNLLRNGNSEIVVTNNEVFLDTLVDVGLGFATFLIDVPDTNTHDIYLKSRGGGAGSLTVRDAIVEEIAF